LKHDNIIAKIWQKPLLVIVSKRMNWIAAAVIAPLIIAVTPNLTGPAAPPSTEEINKILESVPPEEIYPVYTRGFIKSISNYASEKCNPDSRTLAASLSTIPDCNQDGVIGLDERIRGYLDNNKGDDYAAAIAKIPKLLAVVESQKIDFLPIGEYHGKQPVPYILELMKNLQKQGYRIIFVGEYVKSPAFDEFNKANVHDKENKIDPKKLDAVVEKILNKDRTMSLYQSYEYNSPEKLKALFSYLKSHRIPVYPLEGPGRNDRSSSRDEKMAQEIETIYLSQRKKYPREKMIFLGPFGAGHLVNIRPRPENKAEEDQLKSSNVNLNHGLFYYLPTSIKTLPISFTPLFTTRKIPYEGVVHAN
jgi:hypothetical protein